MQTAQAKSQLARFTIPVTGMSCASCERRVELTVLAVGFLGLLLGLLPKVAPQTRSVREE